MKKGEIIKTIPFETVLIIRDFMNSCELTASITALANALACKLSINEVGLLGAAFAQLGDTLTTIALQRDLCENSADNANS